MSIRTVRTSNRFSPRSDRNLATIRSRVFVARATFAWPRYFQLRVTCRLYIRVKSLHLARVEFFPRQRGRREGLATGFQADVATCVVVVVVGSGPGVYSNVVRGGLSRCKTRNTTTRIMLGSLFPCLSPSLFPTSSLHLRLFDSLLTGSTPLDVCVYRITCGARGHGE